MNVLATSITRQRKKVEEKIPGFESCFCEMLMPADYNKLCEGT